MLIDKKSVGKYFQVSTEDKKDANKYSKYAKFLSGKEVISLNLILIKDSISLQTKLKNKK